MRIPVKAWLDRLGASATMAIALVLAGWMCLPGSAGMACAQAVATTTVQGTVYLANGQPASGSVAISWPSFSTANGQSVAGDHVTETIAADGFLSVNLAPNLGSTPAGLYYTAVYYLSDGSTTTQYWVVPAAAQASLAQVQAEVMPAAQAAQAVSKAYVDQAIAELASSLLTIDGGTLTNPLYLSGDPTQPLQAADKHYVDATFAEAVPLAGGNMTGPLQTPTVNAVQSPAAASSQSTLQAAVNAAGTTGAVQIPPTAGLSALWSGTYTANRLAFASDVWPGDALEIDAPSTGIDAQVIVRAVKLSYRASAPDVVEYSLQFANDWASDQAIHTSEAVPADAWLPAAVAPAYLDDLSNLAITLLTGSAIALNAGVTPPAGGGFEIRRRDSAFGPGEDPMLVMRATQPNFSFARESANDRFYIRMFDASTPPRYSEHSTALFLNLPLSS